MHKNPCYLDPQSSSARILKASAAIGMPLGIMGTMFTAFPQEKPIPSVVLRYVFGPLIIHETQKNNNGGIGWLEKETLTRWRQQVDLERIEILCGERPDLISPTELVLVMYNATMDAPLRHELTEVYLWACERTFVAAGLLLPRKGQNSYPHTPTDEDVFDGRLTHTYREICSAVIAKVVRHQPALKPRTPRKSAQNEAP